MSSTLLPVRFWQSALLCTFAACCLLAAPPKTGSEISSDAPRTNINHLDKAWKRYYNSNLGYCVSYPSRWSRDDAYDGTGLVMETGLQRNSKPTGEMDIGLLALPTSDDARLKPAALSDTAVGESLLDDLKDHLEGLQKFVRAERLETIDQHSMQMQGHNALYVKNRYYDPLERASWTEEVVFVKRQGELFRLELQCQTDQLKRFEPVFANFLSTFQIDCK